MIGYAEGKALWASQEQEPCDWGDWADENAAELIEENEALREASDHLDELGTAIHGMINAVPEAKNYLQVNLISRSTGEEMLLTIQRKDGKSPGQMVDELKAEVRRLRCPFVHRTGPLEHKANGCCS